MYDDENEIRRKRRNFIIIGVIIIVVFIVLIIFLTRSKNGYTKKNKVALSCTLEAAREPDMGDTYTSPVVVSINTTFSDSVTIVEKNVGIKENDAFNKEQYTVESTGDNTLIGYVKDSKGNTATCRKNIKIAASKPSCVLEVSKGTLGDKDWYTTPVEVSFKEKISKSSTINSYNIVDSAKISSQNSLYKNNDTLKLEEAGTYKIKGTVIDERNEEGTCTLDVKIDNEEPTCKLKIEKGTPNSSGIYIGETTVVFESTSDEVSKVKEKGIGLEENYKTESYIVETNGDTTITGYVKDEAGNKGTCTLTIDHREHDVPTCELEVVGSELNGQYSGKTIIRFKTKATKSPATIIGYGLGTIKDYQRYEETEQLFLNGEDSIILSGEKNESVIPYGMIKDSNGEIGICSLDEVKVIATKSSVPSCSLEVKSGTKNGNVYLNNVTVGFKDATSTNGATITRYGLTAGNNPTLNDQRTISLGTGDYNVYGIVEDSNGKTVTCGPLKLTIATGNNLLSSVVKPGDRVNYNPGNWSTTAAMPTSNYKFGGYTSGNSKSNGVSCGTTKTNDGWVVISNNGGTVRITTVGNPECFHIPYSTSNNSLAPGYLNSEASNNYVNSTFAVSAMNMDYETANSIRTLKYTDGSDNYVIFTGEYYFLSTVGGNGNTLKGVAPFAGAAEIIRDFSNRTYGTRPVVTLKNGIYTTGKNQGAYTLVTSSTRAIDGDNEQSLKDKIIEIVTSFNY